MRGKAVAVLGGGVGGLVAANELRRLHFSAFVVGLLHPFKRRDWRGLGITEAYLMALFTEMFGVPLTIYLLGSILGFKIGFSGPEGHLWATLLDRLGVLPQAQGVALVMGISTVLILAGLALMAAGWWAVWRAKGELVTGGLYAWMRHPQYTGFILLIAAFLIQWPTIITLIMFPVLVITYRRLATREETELEVRFGAEYTSYRRFVPYVLFQVSQEGSRRHPSLILLKGDAPEGVESPIESSLHCEHHRAGAVTTGRSARQSGIAASTNPATIVNVVGIPATSPITPKTSGARADAPMLTV